MADWLLGMKMDAIVAKHGISRTSIDKWAKRVSGHFKSRRASQMGDHPSPTRRALYYRTAKRVVVAEAIAD